MASLYLLVKHQYDAVSGMGTFFAQGEGAENIK